MRYKIILLLATALLTAGASSNALAGSWGYGYYGGHGYGHHYRPHRYYRHGHYRHRHYRHHRRDRYGYLAAGLVLGGVVHALSQRPHQERVVISRRPVGASGSAPQARGVPAPATTPPVYLRRTAQGECLLIEVLEDGSEAVTPQPAEDC